jgi:flavorubredoxin
MPPLTLHDADGHRNVLLEDFGHGEAVQANQHLIVHGHAGMLLDPGGHKVYAQAIAGVEAQLGPEGHLAILFFSHQDPDVVAAANGWMMTTEAIAYISAVWTRFIPHFGLDRLVLPRLKPIPDQGEWVELGSCRLAFLPAHFLHSPGNFQVWDPESRILYTGDLGASLGSTYQVVEDFDSHVAFMEGFHARYMASGRALKAWVAMARDLPIETIAPQHGAILRGPATVARFLDWCDGLACGVDLLPRAFRVPD